MRWLSPPSAVKTRGPAGPGVSEYTASLAINGLQGVAPTTRDLVLTVAADLGYVPNRLARNLRRKSSTDVGILTANTANPFYGKLVAGIESVVRPRGFHTLVSDATDAGALARFAKPKPWTRSSSAGSPR